MGPLAWAAVGRALGLALASSLLRGGAELAGKQLHAAIVNRELELARAMLRDLQYRHRQAFDDFIKKYGDELPAEVLEELGVA